MYKNRVENDRIVFEIPALLSCECGNPAENGMGKFKIYSFSQDKRAGISKKNSVVLYPIFIHTLC